MSAKNVIRTHTILTYFVLAIAISWVDLLVVVGPNGIPATAEESDNGIVYVPMLLGPAVAGLLMIWVAAGRAGLGRLRGRLLRWRPGVLGYLFAALAVPVLALLTMLPFAFTSPEMRPGAIATEDDATIFLVTGITVGLVVGLFEEIGWTGFAVPQLLQRHGVLATGLMVGLVWGVWHLLLFLWGSGDAAGDLSPALFVPSLVFCLLVLPAIRGLMVWLYRRTDSLPLAIVMHASTTGGVAFIVMPSDAKGLPLAAWVPHPC